jgi:hypothetical protein
MSLSSIEISILLLRFREHKTLLETAQATHLPIASVLSITESAFDKLEAQAVAA